ncbi:MAG TPA: hypothetical protein VMY06_05660 [Sedimentisphaerales bacterium]|nr:hypothetical protein [Sedimentisphaerales bacterium]
MKYCFLMLVLAAVAVSGTGCEQMGAKKRPDTNTEPMTSRESITDDEPLLLLDDSEEELSPPTGPVADNSRCHVCHVNYMQEDIAVTHARANIGCASCHGECDEHIADESWASGGNGTAPDIMYPRAKINPFCIGCHPKDKIDTEQHKPLFSSAGEKKYCTDCHGKHRLENRKCKWK